jgi:CheY-like chemotaxis protein
MTPRVLIVDDDADCGDALKDTLQDVGYEVAIAPSAIDALRQLQSMPPPSVIILDLLMPGMSGEEFLERRQADPVLAEIPVVVVSATPPQSIDRRTPVLRKPLDPAKLLDILASVTSL